MPDFLGLRVAQAEGQVRGKIAGLNPARPLKLGPLSARRAGGMRGVAVKCIDITQNSDREGSLPARN